MGSRGRKAAVDLELIDPRKIEILDRPKPPHELNDEEAEVWHSTVMSEAADKFPVSTHPLLVQFCRHVVQARRVAEMLEANIDQPDFELKDWKSLLIMQNKQSSIIAALAVKMKISQSATVNHRGNKKRTLTRKPWQTEDED